MWNFADPVNVTRASQIAAVLVIVIWTDFLPERVGVGQPYATETSMNFRTLKAADDGTLLRHA